MFCIVKNKKNTFLETLQRGALGSRIYKVDNDFGKKSRYKGGAWGPLSYEAKFKQDANLRSLYIHTFMHAYIHTYIHTYIEMHERVLRVLEFLVCD